MSRNMVPRSTSATVRTEEIRKKWTRLGAGFVGPAWDLPVDLEALIVETSSASRVDERVFEMSSSWISEFSHFIHDDKLAARLREAGQETQAVVGASIEFALMGEMPDDRRARLATIQRGLSPLPSQEHLHPEILEWPTSAQRIERETLPGYAKWGFWYNNKKLKRNALLTAAWMLENCPEIRIRALCGPGDDAEVLFLLLLKGKATTSRLRQVVYQREGDKVIEGLSGRGLIVRVSPNTWSLSTYMASLLTGADST